MNSLVLQALSYLNNAVKSLNLLPYIWLPLTSIWECFVSQHALCMCLVMSQWDCCMSCKYPRLAVVVCHLLTCNIVDYQFSVLNDAGRRNPSDIYKFYKRYWDISAQAMTLQKSHNVFVTGICIPSMSGSQNRSRSMSRRSILALRDWLRVKGMKSPLRTDWVFYMKLGRSLDEQHYYWMELEPLECFMW